MKTCGQFRHLVLQRNPFLATRLILQSAEGYSKRKRSGESCNPRHHFYYLSASAHHKYGESWPPECQCKTSENQHNEGEWSSGYCIVTLLSLHTFILAVIGVLGFCLQLKSPDASPFATAYGTVMMNLFIIVTCFYSAFLVVMGIMATRNNTDFEDLMNKISLLLGSLSLILELLILIPPFGWIALFFWSIWLLCFLIKYYSSLNTLYQSAVALVVEDYGEFKQKLVDLNCRLMDSDAIAPLGRVYRTLKDLIIRNDGRMTGHEAQNQNHTTELRLPV